MHSVEAMGNFAAATALSPSTTPSNRNDSSAMLFTSLLSHLFTPDQPPNEREMIDFCSSKQKTVSGESASTTNDFPTTNDKFHSNISHISDINDNSHCNNGFSGIELLGPFPQTKSCQVEQLCLNQTTVFLVLRRLGCPLVREFSTKVVSQIASYRVKGINVVAVSGDIKTAQKFTSDIWNFQGTPLPLYHDPSLAFFEAMEAKDVKYSKILNFRVLKQLYSMPDRVGDSSDALAKNTNRLGGEVILRFVSPDANTDCTSSSSHRIPLQAITHQPNATSPMSLPPSSCSASSSPSSCGGNILQVLHVGHENEYFEHCDPATLLSKSIDSTVKVDPGLHSIFRGVDHDASNNVIQASNCVITHIDHTDLITQI